MGPYMNTRREKCFPELTPVFTCPLKYAAYYTTEVKCEILDSHFHKKKTMPGKVFSLKTLIEVFNIMDMGFSYQIREI